MLVSFQIHIWFSIPSFMPYRPFRIIFSFLKNILYKFPRWLSDSSKLCLFLSVWACLYVVLVLKIIVARCIILLAFWRLQRKANGQGICTREDTPGLLEQHSMGKLSRENVSDRCAELLLPRLATGSGLRVRLQTLEETRNLWSGHCDGTLARHVQLVQHLWLWAGLTPSLAWLEPV